MVWVLIFYTLEIFKWLIVVRAVMSWVVPPGSRSPVVDLVRRATDPILEPISNVLPNAGGFDLSPILAFIGITVLQQVVGRIG